MNKVYNAFLPDFIGKNKELNSTTRLVYSLLTTVIDDKGSCWVDLDYFMKKYNLGNIAIKRSLKILKEKGFIEIGDRNIVEKLKSKNLKGYGYGDKVCEWCGISTTVLCEHHYPIPKSKGGKKVVKICSNCHQEYHYNNSKITLILTTEELEYILNVREINMEDMFKWMFSE